MPGHPEVIQVGVSNTNHFSSQDLVDINGAFSDRETVKKMIASAYKEKERISKQMNIAYRVNRSDRKEWKIRHESLMTTIKGMEFLACQIMVTSGRVPAC